MQRFRAVVVTATIWAVLLGWVALRAGQRPPDQLETYAPQALRRDARLLWDLLANGHGGLERYTEKDALEKRFNDTIARITAPQTVLDFYRDLLPLVAAIHDGHTGLGLPASAAAWLDARPTAFPFELRFLEGRAYLFRNLGDDRVIEDGSELLSIDGRPVSEVVEPLVTWVCADASIRTRRLRLLENPSIFSRYLGLATGFPSSYRIEYRPRGGSASRRATIRAVAPPRLAAARLERYPALAAARPRYELAFRGGIAVLTIRGFGDDRTPGAAPYPAFLESSFREMAARKSAGLVIDLRGNGGGADAYGKLLFSYVMDRPFLYYRALEMRDNRFEVFRRVTGEQSALDSQTRGLVRNARGWYDVPGHSNSGIQQPSEPRFAGQVVILVDGLSFSTTGETTSLFHYHRKARFVGEECGAGYYGNTSGFGLTATLPETGIQVRIPFWLYTLAVEGYPADRGIVPDYPVSPTIDDLLAGRDPAMATALRVAASPPAT